MQQACGPRLGLTTNRPFCLSCSSCHRCHLSNALAAALLQARRLQSSGGPISDGLSGGTNVRGESEPLLPADLGGLQGVELQRVLSSPGKTGKAD